MQCSLAPMAALSVHFLPTPNLSHPQQIWINLYIKMSWPDLWVGRTSGVGDIGSREKVYTDGSQRCRDCIASSLGHSHSLVGDIFTPICVH